MRRIALVFATLLILATAVPVLAARPTIIDFEFDDEADSAFFTEICGFPVTSDSDGHVVVHNDKRGAVTALSNYNIKNRLTSANGTYHLVDVGPDMEHTRAGTPYFVVVGRSLTLSTVIGRVEVNLDTGETTYHGRLLGTEVFDPALTPICDALR